MSSRNSLFICLTPLQMKIVESIIIQEKIINYKIICLFLIDNEKYEYYFEKINKNSKSSFVYFPGNKLTGLSFLLDVYLFKKQLLKSKILNNIDSVYLASIDNRYVQAIVSLIQTKDLYTFDDGLANLNYDGSYYKNEKLSNLRLFLWKIVGVSLFTQDLRGKSINHFTLYAYKKNINKCATLVSIYNSEEYKNRDKSNSGEITVFLGQPLYEIDPSYTSLYLNSILKKMDIDFYFPHPRENYIIDESIKKIKTSKIFEDYIFDLYESEGFPLIKVYTFCSTAILNIMNFYFIDVFVVYDEIIMNNKMKNIFKEFNVKFINLD